MKIEFNKDKFMREAVKVVGRAVKESAIELQADIQQSLNKGSSNIGSGGKSSPAGDPPFNNTGALMRSIQAVDITVDPLIPKWRVGTNLIYAGIQEYGGRIRAKKGKFLAIPVGPQGRRAAKQAKGNLRSLNLKFIPNKKGGGLLVKEMPVYKNFGKGSHNLILFVLKKEVYLPARPYIRPAYARMQTRIKKKIEDAIAKIGVAA